MSFESHKGSIDGGKDVARGDSLAQLTDIRNMEVRAFVPLKHLPRAVVGEPIRMFAMDAAYERQIRALVPTGDSAGELVSVIGPIDAGDRVAIRGAENLQEGSDVRVLSNPESTLSSASSDS